MKQVQAQAGTDADTRLSPTHVIAVSARGHLIGAACSVVVVGVSFLKWGGGTAFLLGLLTAAVFALIDSRAIIAAGLLCVAACPLGMLAQDGAWLQQSTIVNYYAASVGIYGFQDISSTLVTWALYLLGIGTMGRVVQYVVARTRDHSLHAEVC